MNIKSLLLGSAAAMVTVSGAQAADAVVVEAEPVEYVRVCDAYGSGYFFIPGTETCIRFSGLVRTYYDKLNVDIDGPAPAGLVATGPDFENTTWQTRARLNIDTRNETDWGTLRSLIRFQANDAGDDGAAASDLEVDAAFISLAGFRVGISGSLFNANGAAGMNLQGLGQLSDDGSYGFSNAHVLDYTYAVDGLTLSVGIEDANGDDASDPSFLARAQYAADFGTVGVVGEFSEGDINDLYKVYATLDLSEFIPGGVLGGFYAWQDDLDGSNIANGRFQTAAFASLGGLQLPATTVWGIGFQMNLTDNVEFIAYHNNFEHDDLPGSVGDEHLTTIALNWYPVSGLQVFSAYSFGEGISSGTFAPSVATTGITEGTEVEFDRFMIGLTRSF